MLRSTLGWSAFALVELVVVVGAAPSAPVPEGEVSPEIKKLMVARRDELRKGLAACEEEFKAGRINVDGFLDVSRALLKADLALAGKPAERIAACERHLKVISEIDRISTLRYEAGRLRAAEYHLMRAERYSAEIDLLKAGGKVPKDVKPVREPEFKGKE